MTTLDLHLDPSISMFSSYNTMITIFQFIMILRIRISPPFTLLGLALNWLLLLLLNWRTPLALLLSCCRSWGRRHKNVLFLNNRSWRNHYFDLLFSFLGAYTPLLVIFRSLILFRFFSPLPHRLGIG